MVVVELLARLFEVEIVLRTVVPRQFEQQLQVGYLHRIFGYGGVEPFEFLQLLLEEFGHLLGPVLLLGLFAHLVQFSVGAVAQFVLDGAHLLLEVVVALLLVDLLLDLLLDLVLQLDELLVADQYFEQFARARQQPRRFEQRLPVFVRQFEVGADEVDDTSPRVDVLDGENRLLGHVGRDVDDIERHVADRIHKCVELDVLLVGRRILQRGHPGLQIGVGRDVFADLDLLQTVENDREVAVGHLQYLHDAGGRTDAVHVLRLGLFHVAVALQDGGQHPVAGVGVAHERHAPRAAHRDGGDGARKQHRAAQRQHGKYFGDGDLFDRVVLAGDDGDDAVVAVERFGQRFQFFQFDFISFTHMVFQSSCKDNAFFCIIFYISLWLVKKLSTLFMPQRCGAADDRCLSVSAVCTIGRWLRGLYEKGTGGPSGHVCHFGSRLPTRGERVSRSPLRQVRAGCAAKKDTAADNPLP